MKKIFNYIMLFAVALTGLSLTACSDDEISTNQYDKNGVNILAFGPMPITRGETMRLTGTNLDKVKEVLFPEGNQKLVESKTYIKGDFTLKGSEEMTVTIPDLCVPGKIRLVTNTNDTIISASNITFNEEIKAEALSPLNVHAGDTISITGDFVWNIQSVTFSAGVKVEAENFVKNTRKEILVLVPVEAITGPVTFSAGDDSEEVTIANNLIVDAAQVTSLSNETPDFNQQITIYGENLDLITEVDFPSVPEVEFTVAPDRKSITTTIPAAATSGDIILVSHSGLTTSISITLPLAQYEMGSIAPAKNLQAGQTVSFNGENLDRVIALNLPGGITLEKGQFTQSKTSISFQVPAEMGDGKVVLVQHDKWSIETDRIAMYAAEGPVKVIWKDKKAIGWDGAGQIYLGTDGGPELLENNVNPGDKLRIKLEPTASDWVAQIWEGHWGYQIEEIKAENYDLEAEGGYYTITLTEENIKTFTTAQGWGGIVLVQGQSMDVTELAIVKKAEGKVIWKDNKAIGWSGEGQVYIGTDGGPELIEAGAKAGDKLIISLEPTADDWCAQIWEGHWGYQIEEIKPENYDLAANGGYVITLTNDLIQTFTTAGGWGGMLLVQGQNMNVTKLTLIQN